MVNKTKKRETTNHTNSTNKGKKTLFFINSFVKFVLFVVEKWGVGRKTIKKSVVF
jgi:hypothetical protein